ncbi:NAD(P)-dependent dehydrogenase, short-chain alcohol dehydrogenase family [Hymenobacter gelipurpurascens]|uniref:NAD(P)-dependent dehydrogenase, short-chain alcohol dehydrogenase family n=1 Tax=Hymenobacter gelipurpurascens TaxID=89968 RepID=A0A212UCK9_9BACT|nr:SDR family oxidoreductase [Hymenobacter gelipurpurascens]SNC75985.1 NAD(P)-dependent dehydrogenase, short-chain alcohol dehydrogenase family [Hymenobacter gelipurpurascens]
MRFNDKVVLVTGGASGIGLAICKRMASEGARLVLVDYSQEKLDKAVPLLTAAGAPEVWPSLCDVGVEAQVEATVQGALQKFGRLDVVVNNAGLMQFKPLEELTGEDWMRILNVDLLGAFYFTKQAFLHMKPGGTIVNVSSIHAIETSPLVAPYAAAKAAVNSLTRSAALEGKAKGLRVNSVLPGAIDTPMLWENPNVKSGAEKIDPADVGRPEDVAALVAYLASADAEFVQGAEVRVDGGRLGHL